MPGTQDLFDATLDSAEEAELIHYITQAPNNIPGKNQLPVEDLSTVADTADAVEQNDSPSHKSCLYDLFDRRIKEKKWSLQQRMPREKKDVEFDQLLKELSVKRAYGLRMWLHFRKSKGISAPIKITEPITSLLLSFFKKLTQAISELTRFQNLTAGLGMLMTTMIVRRSLRCSVPSICPPISPLEWVTSTRNWQNHSIT
jgi:hypothetical protein